MKVTSIIQARMNSKRLPGKILMKVNDKTMIDHLVNRIRKVEMINDIVISTTKNKKDDKLVKLCLEKNYLFFRGSENNVLKRIFDTAKKFKSNIIVFITADCPIIDYRIIRKTLNYYLKNSKNYDYVGNSFLRSYPDGMDVHVFSFKALKRNIKFVTNKLEKEHVTLGIKNRPKKFKIKTITSTKNLFLPQLGLTLDEKDDFKLIKKIILYFEKKKNYFFSCKEIIHLLKKKKKNWMKINHHVVRKGDT